MRCTAGANNASAALDLGNEFADFRRWKRNRSTMGTKIDTPLPRLCPSTIGKLPHPVRFLSCLIASTPLLRLPNQPLMIGHKESWSFCSPTARLFPSLRLTARLCIPLGFRLTASEHGAPRCDGRRHVLIPVSFCPFRPETSQ